MLKKVTAVFPDEVYTAEIVDVTTEVAIVIVVLEFLKI
jgi:hypothetical protein